MLSSITTQMIVILLAIGLSHGALADEDIPQKSAEGLVLVKNSPYGILYIKPNTNFSIYKRLALLETTVAFRENWRRELNRKALGINERVTKQDVIDIKQRITDGFRESFTDNLVAQHGFELAELTAADVLVLEPSIVNVDIRTTHEASAIGLFNYSFYDGQMTLLMNFYDSVSGTLVARFIDRQAIKSDGSYRIGTEVTNTAEGNIIFLRWANSIGDYLNELSTDQQN